MQLSTRAMIPGCLLCALLLAGCPVASDTDVSGPVTTQSKSSSSSSTGNGGPYNVTGKLGGGGEGNPGTDTVVATPQTSSLFKVVVGTSATFSITFTTSDGSRVQGLGVEGLSALPAAWTGKKTPTVFGCQTVSTGSGCVLNLTYTPTTVGPGSFTLSYIWINASASAQTLGGTITVNYEGTVHNHIIGTPSPTGQINAVVGAAPQTVTVNFVTDDGYSASALDVASLPSAAAMAGWSSTGVPFTCASVSTGNGCQLTLTFTPTAYAIGTMALGYSYVDNAGSPQTGSLNIPYAATTDDTAVATRAPAGQITAVVGAGSQPVAVTFTTSDGNPASNLDLTTDLSSLPAGWSSTASSFTCATFSTGNGCQLPLSFQPTTFGSGTLTLNYTYLNDSGVASSGSYNINYTATTNDSVQGAANPSGQITSTAGTSLPVTVTFTTNDGATATNFTITNGLSPLPTGWSSSTGSTFGCAAVSTGTGCQLALTYDPPASSTSGTLTLSYSYIDDAGNPGTGTVNLPYSAN